MRHKGSGPGGRQMLSTGGSQGRRAERTPSEAQEAFNDQMGKGRYSRISDIRG